MIKNEASNEIDKSIIVRKFAFLKSYWLQRLDIILPAKTSNNSEEQKDNVQTTTSS